MGLLFGSSRAHTHLKSGQVAPRHFGAGLHGCVFKRFSFHFVAFRFQIHRFSQSSSSFLCRQKMKMDAFSNEIASV